MGLFDEYKVDENELKDESTGGGFDFEPIRRTGAYPFRIKNAYAFAAKSGALGIKLELIGTEGSLTHSEYVVSGDEKGNKKMFSYDKYIKLHFIVTGKKIDSLHTEKKPMMVYDYESRQNVEKEVDVFVDWIGKDVMATCVRSLEDKWGSDEGEITDTVKIKAFLTPSGRTYGEIGKNEDEPKYLKGFNDKYDVDYIEDKRKDTADKPVPTIYTVAELKAQREAEKAKEMGGDDGFGGGMPDVDINEDEIPF